MSVSVWSCAFFVNCLPVCLFVVFVNVCLGSCCVVLCASLRLCGCLWSCLCVGLRVWLIVCLCACVFLCLCVCLVASACGCVFACV